MPDGCKKLLMPGAQEDPPAFSEMVHPVLLIFYLHPEGRAVEANKPVKKKEEQVRLCDVSELNIHS